MDKIARWEDVRAKGEAIVAAGGVEIIAETVDEIEAYVMSGVVEGEFPVHDGGPYHVILSKRTWENRKNVGGWIQGYLCDCTWGFYNSGEPGPRFKGRFCSHAYATLLAADARARHDFMDDRTAASEPERVDFGFRWSLCKLSDGRYAASYRGCRAGLVSPPTPSNDADRYIGSMREAILEAREAVGDDADWALLMADDTDAAYDRIWIDGGAMKESVYHDWFEDEDGYTGWAIPFTLYQCDESEPWYGMDYGDALDNGFDFSKYGYSFDGLFDSSKKFDADERTVIGFILSDIERGDYGDAFQGTHKPGDSDIVEFETGFYYVGRYGIRLIDPERKGRMVANRKQSRVQPKVLDPGSVEYGNMQDVCDGLNAMHSETEFHIEDVYFDYGQDWKWTTIVAERNGDEWQVLNPVEFDMVCNGDVMGVLDMVRNGEYSHLYGFASKQAGRRLEYEDDIVIVRNPDGGIDYKGVFDYCPYKDNFDNGDWRFDGEKYEDRDHPGYTLEVIASKAAASRRKAVQTISDDGDFGLGDTFDLGYTWAEITRIDGNSLFLESIGGDDEDFPCWVESYELRRDLEDSGMWFEGSKRLAADTYTVDIYGTDIVLEAGWNGITVVFPDGTRNTIKDAYSYNEYELTGKIMDMLSWGSDEEFDELQESVWNAIGDCLDWEGQAYFGWEGEAYASKQAGDYFDGKSGIRLEDMDNSVPWEYICVIPYSDADELLDIVNLEGVGWEWFVLDADGGRVIAENDDGTVFPTAQEALDDYNDFVDWNNGTMYGAKKTADEYMVECHEFSLGFQPAYRGTLCNGEYSFEIVQNNHSGEWECFIWETDKPYDVETAYGAGGTYGEALQDAAEELRSTGVHVTALEKRAYGVGVAVPIPGCHAQLEVDAEGIALVKLDTGERFDFGEKRQYGEDELTELVCDFLGEACDEDEVAYAVSDAYGWEFGAGGAKKAGWTAYRTDSGLGYDVLDEPNPEWSTYDKAVADGMMNDFGYIFVDGYGQPIDDEFAVEEILEHFEKQAQANKNTVEADWKYFEDGYCFKPLWTYYIGDAGRYSGVHLMVVQWGDTDYEWSIECATRTLDSGHVSSLESAQRQAISEYEYRFPRGPKISARKTGAGTVVQNGDRFRYIDTDHKGPSYEPWDDLSGVYEVTDASGYPDYVGVKLVEGDGYGTDAILGFDAQLESGEIQMMGRSASKLALYGDEKVEPRFYQGSVFDVGGYEFTVTEAESGYETRYMEDFCPSSWFASAPIGNGLYLHIADGGFARQLWAVADSPFFGEGTCLEAKSRDEGPDPSGFQFTDGNGWPEAWSGFNTTLEKLVADFESNSSYARGRTVGASVKNAGIWAGNNNDGYMKWTYTADDGWWADVFPYFGQWAYEVYDPDGWCVSDGEGIETEDEAKEWAECLAIGHGIGCPDDRVTIDIVGAAKKTAGQYDYAGQHGYLVEFFVNREEYSAVSGIYKYVVADSESEMESKALDYMSERAYRDGVEFDGFDVIREIPDIQMAIDELHRWFTPASDVIANKSADAEQNDKILAQEMLVEELQHTFNEAICEYDDALEHPDYYDIELAKKKMDEAQREYEMAKDELAYMRTWYVPKMASDKTAKIYNYNVEYADGSTDSFQSYYRDEMILTLATSEEDGPLHIVKYDIFDRDYEPIGDDELAKINTAIERERKKHANRIASVKNATRTFTYAEMQELEDEVIDKPWLNNADRLKNPDMLIGF